jgi:hypothetical protein
MAGESRFRDDFNEELKHLFPGAILLKNDSSYLQGVPDWTFLWEDRWAAFELKGSYKDFRSNRIPNQAYYVGQMNAMSFASFVYPENKDEVLDGLQHAFQPARQARFPRR